MILSVQMYSLRNDVGRDGLETVFKKIKAAGFGGVEFAGTYNMRLDDLKKMLDDNGLVATGAHVGWDLLNKSVAECVDTAAALGYKDIICPGIWKDEIWQPDIYDRVNAIAAEIPAGTASGTTTIPMNSRRATSSKGCTTTCRRSCSSRIRSGSRPPARTLWHTAGRWRPASWRCT